MTDASFASQFEDDFGPATPADAKKPVDPASSAHPTNPTMARAVGPAYVEKCTDCRGTGQFVSWSGRVVGQCFKCKGKGERTFRASAADRAQNRAKTAQRKADKAASALEQFAAQHPAEWAWIEGARATFDFAQSMYDAIQKFGSLTERQLAACTSAAAKNAVRQAERAAAATARLEAAPVIDMTKIEAAFAAARGNGLKSLKLRVGELVISPAKATSANAGALYVKSKGGFDNSTYFGKIMGGKFLKSRDCDAATEALIISTATDPLAAAIAYGKATGICSCCGRELTNKISIDMGIGPICREKWGLG